MSEQKNLQDRLSFIKIDGKAQAALLKAQNTIQKALPGSLDAFYDQIRRFPDVAKFFSNESHISGAKNAQAQHWSHISSGRFDRTYVDSVQRIGATHARIGLEPRWYIGGYALVLEGLVGAIIMDHEAKRRRWGKSDGGVELGATVGAVIKAALLDMDFVISIYLEAAETARKEADDLRAEAEELQEIVVEETARALSRLADGDLTARITEDFAGDYRKLKDDFNSAIERLESSMTEISSNTAAMRSGAGEISQAADDLSRRTEQQAATLEETAAALDQITATVRRTAEGAQRAGVVVGSAREDAERSGEVVSKAVEAMGDIEHSAEQISQIIGVIDEIAFQTNLLALNAGVEAARAGDAGKGFAVVASEVRALAQRSAEAAKEIKSLISASTNQVKTGVSLVGQTGEALTAIVGRVSEINGLMSEISASAVEQATALGEVNTAVNQMDQTTQQNAAMVEQSTAASHSLTQETEQLARLVGRFKVTEERASEAPRRSAPRAPEARGPNAVRESQSRIADFARRYSAPPRSNGSLALKASSEAEWEEF
jgi:methyl-accepting chemotaxis protein